MPKFDFDGPNIGGLKTTITRDLMDLYQSSETEDIADNFVINRLACEGDLVSWMELDSDDVILVFPILETKNNFVFLKESLFELFDDMCEQIKSDQETHFDKQGLTKAVTMFAQIEKIAAQKKAEIEKVMAEEPAQ